MKITAALLMEQQTPFEIETLDLMSPRAGEVLVRISAVGVCHSDYHLVSGDTKHPMPVVAGHEGAGIVTEVGPGVTRVRPGDHVILNWAPACGHCFYCLRDKPNLCAAYVDPIWAGTMLDGSPRLSRRGQPVYHYCGLAAFAEYAVVPAVSCVPIPAEVPLPTAALVGCAVATGVGAAMYTAGIRPGESVVVFGCGGVGLNILQGAALCGAAPIIAVDSNPAKLALARRFGATHGLLSDAHCAAAVRELTGGRGADHALEAVGRPAVQESALEVVRPGGVLTLVGLAPMGAGTNLPGAILVRQEKTVRGSYYGSVNAERDFPLLIDLYQSGRLQLDELVTREYRLDEINSAFADMLAGTVARGVIVMNAA